MASLGALAKYRASALVVVAVGAVDAGDGHSVMVPLTGFEPARLRLKAACSTN